MVAKWHETEGPLLAPEAREYLRECRARRESRLREQIDIGEVVTLTADAVREFANGLLVSQGELGPHAGFLREYTASLVNEMRSAPALAQMLRSSLSLPWARDPIALKAMEVCEEVIAERDRVGDRWPYRPPMATAKNLIWAPIVQAWESYKAANQIESAHRECIPESVLRGLLGSQRHIKPAAVTREQIRKAGAELCCHYGPVAMLPMHPEDTGSVKSEPAPKRGRRFWEEREDEFRRHNTPRNSQLSAVWYSLDGTWSFHSAPGNAAATKAARQVFQSLAQLAVKGLAGACRAESWLDWLEALRRATDRSTGECLYSKVSQKGSYRLGESELERIARSGERIPAGGLVEFVVARQPEGEADRSTDRVPSCADAEMRKVWDTTAETIENLFASSANFCLELRARVSSPMAVPAVATNNPASGPKHGPKPDYELALKIARIVAAEADDGKWRAHVEDICVALDEAKIPCPKTWKARHEFGSWYASVATDDATARQMAIKAIQYRLNRAKERTLS